MSVLGARKNTVQVKVGKLEETEQASAQEQPKPKARKDDGGTVTTLGLTLSNITPELKEKFSLNDDSKGVVVAKDVDELHGNSVARRCKGTLR